jgi:hypothetical protein
MQLGKVGGGFEIQSNKFWECVTQNYDIIPVLETLNV